jgi:hypothetical protein
MNAMLQMASTLGARAPHCYSKAAAMRLALTSGPKTAAQLALAANVEPADVRGILKADIDLGRIRLAAVRGAGGRVGGSYSIAEEFDGELQERLRAARALLIRHGYSVSMSRSADGRA